MPIGPKPSLQALASGLDPSLLRLFVRDLLAERGFRNIRDFDGVGDGGRDLEGTDPDGQTWVIQLKYRQDPNAGTPTNEFAELPMALVRLGRTHGLFITNGKLTAPAKRDSANSFPGLTLKFMEGVDLLDALASAPITTALWLSGVEMQWIRRQVRFGVVCRALPSDRSRFLDQLPEVTAPDWQDQFGIDTVAAVALARRWFDYSDFEPFRPPGLLTMNEGSLDRVLATEVTIHGQWTLDQLPALQETIGINIASKWSQKDLHTCAVRISRPSVLEPGSAERLAAAVDPVTILGCSGRALLESAWLRESLGHWTRPSWIQMYQAMSGAYFLLLPESNILCQLKYRAMTSRSELGMALQQRAYFDRWWKRSLFFFSLERFDTDEECDDPLAPHYCYRWVDGRWIVAWLHPRHQGRGAERQLRGDESDGDHDPLRESEAETKYMDAVLEKLNARQLERIPPDAAYHALCFVTEGDAAPSVMWRTYDTGKLLEYTREVPSPIDVFDVDCVFSAAYVVEDRNDAEKAFGLWKTAHAAGWEIRVFTAGSLPTGRSEIDFLAGDVDRAMDERVVLVSIRRAPEVRMRLDHRMQHDAVLASSVFDSLETQAGLARPARQSRKWLRERWAVYFVPEYPDSARQQVIFR